MSNTTNWLPPLVTLEEFGGNWDDYYDAVYDLFREDWIRSRPDYLGRRMGLKKHPIVDGKEYTFYHLTHEGKIESERRPDLRRMERIRWPRALIEAAATDRVRLWPSVRHTRSGRKDRIQIATIDFSYVTVLDDRVDYLLIWTAYAVEREHQQRALRAQYERYKKAETAP